MGTYLNSPNAYTLYRDETTKPYFVDMTGMLGELFSLVEQGSNYICLTRPRRFGKTMAAEMIAAFFSKAQSASDVFDRLLVARMPGYQRHRNRYDVIYISFNELPKRCSSYEQYIARIENRLMKDLVRAYPDTEIDEEGALWDALSDLYAQDCDRRFVFVFDEWDYMFHRDFVTEADKKAYLEFLGNLLKGKPYVRFAYMTGILPIAKYSSGSELNLFLEYTMAAEEKYSEYFGFTEAETDALFCRYQAQNHEAAVITRDGLRLWYDGYHTKAGERVYNPRSVVAALTNHNLGSYWTSAGPYDEFFYYVEKNIAAVREDLALMVSGIPVPARIREYAATSMKLSTRDEIFSAMVVYGFLSYENGCVMIPNRELMEKFDDMLKKEPALGYVHRLSKESDRLLKATKEGDTRTMCAVLEYAHNTESLLSYNREEDLTVVVTLAYLSARDFYRVEREEKAGTGYADPGAEGGRYPAERDPADPGKGVCTAVCSTTGGKTAVYGTDSCCGDRV